MIRVPMENFARVLTTGEFGPIGQVIMMRVNLPVSLRELPRGLRK